MSSINRIANNRLVVLQVLLAVWIVAIGYRLVRLQVREHEQLAARAERQQQAAIELSPTRGLIFDRNGNELARSVRVKSLYASPSAITDPAGVADRLARLLDIDREALFKRLTSSQVLVAVKRKLDEKEAAEVEKLQIPGLSFVGEMKRFYVSGATAAHVLGFVDMDERGMGGIEQTYDRLIRGQAGRLEMEVDAHKKPYAHDLQESVPGADVTLTIDILIQHHVEQALAEAARQTGARGATAVVIRPATGEILALANYPSFDPNRVGQSDDRQRRNFAVEVTFEPGSIFKIVPYSAALEERVIGPETTIDCPGEVRVADRVVREKPLGTVSAAQALAKSSNVAAIKIGQRLGQQKLARYIDQFGFGRRTGIELPAEARGLLRDVEKWNPASICAIPMGYEVGVTALQTAAAFAAIANGGEYVQPYLVSRVRAAGGEVIEEHRPERRRVVSPETAAMLRAMLEEVVLKGTGQRARLSGYRAAGKTGTARKVDEATGHYSKGLYVSSFAGFAPVDNPEIACIVSLDEPRGQYYGGHVAAPVFARIASETLHLLGVPPEEDPALLAGGDSAIYEVPRAILEEPMPDAGELAAQRPGGPEPLDAPPVADGEVVVPDLIGRGIREALALCAERGLKVQASGAGVVTSQSPPPGTGVAPATICYVRLARPPGRDRPPKGITAKIE